MTGQHARRNVLWSAVPVRVRDSTNGIQLRDNFTSPNPNVINYGIETSIFNYICSYSLPNNVTILSS